jgi:hypothetical protein
VLAGAPLLETGRGMVAGVGIEYVVPLGVQGGAQAGAHPQAG